MQVSRLARRARLRRLLLVALRQLHEFDALVREFVLDPHRQRDIFIIIRALFSDASLAAAASQVNLVTVVTVSSVCNVSVRYLHARRASRRPCTTRDIYVSLS